jgi:hypothetical protein
VEQNGFVTSHELQLVEQPESIAKQDNDGEKQGIGNHSVFISSQSVFGICGAECARREPVASVVFNTPFSTGTVSSGVERPSGVSFRKASKGNGSSTLTPSTSEMA